MSPLFIRLLQIWCVAANDEIGQLRPNLVRPIHPPQPWSVAANRQGMTTTTA
jgi:hypothetical protein